MGAQIIDGRAIAQKLALETAHEISQLMSATGKRPVLVSIYVGSNPAIDVYIRSQSRTARRLGMEYRWYHFPDDCEEQEILRRIDQLNGDPEVTGLILQLPLPPHINRSAVVNRIDPAKDVDGTHPETMGAVLVGDIRIGSCTALAVMELLDSTGVSLEGKEAVIVGHGELVGKPVSLLLLDRLATVTICHVATARRGLLADHVRRAEVLVVAVGQHEVIKGEWIRNGAVVIDVGISQVNGKVVGDVEFAAAQEAASFITPVPGGVGPVTVSMLMRNTLKAFKAQTAKCD